MKLRPHRLIRVHPPLGTTRLFLRPLELADAAETQTLFPHWEIVRYLNGRVPWPYPADGALSYYRDVLLPAVERGEQWHWTLRLRERPEQLIGCIGLFRSETDNRAFWLGLPWQRLGLMTEACRVVNDFWFEVLAFQSMRVTKCIANEASRRLSMREGMKVVKQTTQDSVSGYLPGEMWEMSAEHWRSLRPGA